jgi:myo-inositol-1(or 4)-monophosphatase
MTNQELKNICQKTGDLMRQVGAFLLEESGKVKEQAIEHKSLNSLVSYVDKTAEEQLIKGCQQILPEAGFLTEEGMIEQNLEKAWRWIIDPLDGTTNFLHQLPFFSISVALQYQEKTVVGLVYEPNRDELFYAWKDGGCWLNQEQVFVTNRDKLADTLLATGFPYYDFKRTAGYLKMLGELMQGTRGLRRCGSAALDLAYTAAGRFDAFFEYSLAPWDVAAGAFLVEEAGGLVTDFSGGNDYLFGKEIVVGNPVIQKVVLQFAKEYLKV